MALALKTFAKITPALAAHPHAAFEEPGYSARVAIPDYDEHVATHYGRARADIRKALGFSHFGVIVDFDKPTQVIVHNDERHLDTHLQGLIASLGPVLLRNALLPEHERTSSQRNIFPNSKFHIDRGHLQSEQISMFWRDPHDPVQAAPRTSSTLIMANHAASLQALNEGHEAHDLKPSYEFFKDKDISAMIGKVLLELPWNAPHGIGEIAFLDNRTVMHASYYPRASNKGYPISVRYLE